MQSKTLTLNYNIFDSIEDPSLDTQIRELIEAAKSACDLAHAPYSKFRVGASVLLQDGKTILKGANQENAAYPLCTCAEQVAIYHAAMQHPNTPIKALAIHVGVHPESDHPPSPCGACRQVILESEQKYGNDIQIYISSLDPSIFRFESIKSLLPFYFSGDDLVDLS